MTIIEGSDRETEVNVKDVESDALEYLRTCNQAGEPRCLELALTHMFGSIAKERVKGLLRLDFDKQNFFTTRGTFITEVYESYLQAFQKRFGKDTAEIIDFQISKEIERIGCSNRCPVYRKRAENIPDGIPVIR